MLLRLCLQLHLQSYEQEMGSALAVLSVSLSLTVLILGILTVTIFTEFRKLFKDAVSIETILHREVG